MNPSSAFWDTSALVPLCFHQEASSVVRRLSRAFSSMVVWWGAPVEAVNAFARLAREGAVSKNGLHQARTRLDALRRTWVEILPTDAVRGIAEGLPTRLALRTGDVFQLAAALIWCRERPKGRPFVSLDRRLAEAALQVGFEVMAGRVSKS